MSQHLGTFTVACTVTDRCAGRARGVLIPGRILVCTVCDVSPVIPNVGNIQAVPQGAKQWWVRGRLDT